MPANSLLLRPLQQREAILSSRLEGTFATAEELLAYGLEPKAPASTDDPVNAWREVFNYDRALQQGQTSLSRLPLASRLIRELHAALLDGVRGADRTPGEFRTRQVHIGSDRRFVPAPPNAVPDLVKDLEHYINEPDDTDALIRAFLAHYQFETIHPFLDGNGRVGRLLLSLMVFTSCGLQSPWLYLSPYFEKYKDEYIDRLFAVSATGDWAGWVAFCLRATSAQAVDALARVDRLLKLKERYESRIARSRYSSARLPQIVASLFASAVTTIPAVAKEFKVTFPTAQADIEKLTKMGVLSPSKRKSKPKYYIATEIFHLAYEDDVVIERRR
jgi:Fic family protein